MNENLIYNFMENMNLPTFLVVAIDKNGVPLMQFRSNSPAGHRALRGFVEDWIDEQAMLNEPSLTDANEK